MPYEVQLEIWSPGQGKGIDDLLVTGGKPDLLVGDAVETYIRNLVDNCQGDGAGENDDTDHATLVAGSDEDHEENHLAGSDVSPPLEEVKGKPPANSTTLQPAAVGGHKGPAWFLYGTDQPATCPLDFFPEPLQVVAQEISQAINCPLDFPACAVVSVSATAIGRRTQR